MVEPTTGPLAGQILAVLTLLTIAAVIAHTYLQDRKDRTQ